MTRAGVPRSRVLVVTTAITMIAAATSLAVSQVEQPADAVIVNGRVIDPESGLDAIRNVRIRDGRIEAISTDPLAGTVTVDASGFVVAPGFIDLHHHARLTPVPDIGVFKAMDGVTTAMELEVGTADVDGWFAARQGNAVINYGVSAGHVPTQRRQDEQRHNPAEGKEREMRLHHASHISRDNLPNTVNSPKQRAQPLNPGVFEHDPGKPYKQHQQDVSPIYPQLTVRFHEGWLGPSRHTHGKRCRADAALRLKIPANRRCVCGGAGCGRPTRGRRCRRARRPGRGLHLARPAKRLRWR